MVEDQLENEKNREKNRFLKRIPTRFRRLLIRLSIIFSVLLFLTQLLFRLMPSVHSSNRPNEENDSIRINNIGINIGGGEINQENEIEEKTLISIKDEGQETNCFTGSSWQPFSDDIWPGLRSRFERVNGVYTIPELLKGVDSVSYYSKPCKGGIQFRMAFVPFSLTLININQYYSSWFRWEIGGNDLNSVKLYKNSDGCTAMKQVREVKTESQYFPTGKRVKSGEQVITEMLVYLTKSGKLRTELNIPEFVSEKSGEQESIYDRFFYEFDVSVWKCDEDTVLNVEQDAESIGVGLMPSSFSYENAERPRVKLEYFIVEPYVI